MTTKERDELIDALLDEQISEADFLRLEAEMRVSSGARSAYYQRLKLYRSLTVEAAALSEKEEVRRVSFFRRHLPALLGTAAAVLFLLAGGMGWQIGKKNESQTAELKETIASGFASVAEESEAVWEGLGSPRRGDLLPQGPLKLKSGMVQLELFSGVTLILEGECAFELKSPMELALDRGRARALVPDAAHGFRVTTAKGDVVDLGTEFAVDVTPERSDVVVLQGEVEWHPLSEEKLNLVDGEGLGWTSEGSQDLDESLRKLPVIGDLMARFSLGRDQQRALWLKDSQLLERDPRLVAYYPMTRRPDTLRKVTDRSRSGLDGSIVAAHRGVDRWGQLDGAIDFSPAGSRVRVFVPGDHKSLTFYCWARIDSLDRKYNSLFLTDGHELNEPHWQILEDGRLFFSVKRRDSYPKFKDKHIAYSPPFWTPEKSGKWFQIATVYNTEERSTTHYVNGKQLSKDFLSDEFFVDTVRIGPASIGNWNEPSRSDPSFAVRNLNGAIDEFAIFSEALSAEEIERLYEIGKP